MASKNVIASMLLGLSIVLTVYLSPVGFSLFALVFILLSLFEFYTFSGVERLWVPLFFGGGISLSFLAEQPLANGAALALALLIYTITRIFTRKENAEKAFREIAVVVFGWVYIAWLMGHVILIRYMPNGSELTLLFLLLTALRNIGSGLLGKKVKGHTISPLSKNKTYEGAFIGMLSSTLVVGGVWYFMIEAIPLADFIALSVIIGVLGQGGDLVESLLKRAGNVDSSSSTLGGQGGFFDTVDSFAFTAPATFYFFYIKDLLS